MYLRKKRDRLLSSSNFVLTHRFLRYRFEGKFDLESPESGKLKEWHFGSVGNYMGCLSNESIIYRLLLRSCSKNHKNFTPTTKAIDVWWMTSFSKMTRNIHSPKSLKLFLLPKLRNKYFLDFRLSPISAVYYTLLKNYTRRCYNIKLILVLYQ